MTAAPHGGADGRKQRERAFHDQRFADDPRLVTRRFYDVDEGRRRYRDNVLGFAGTGVSALEYGCGTGSLADGLVKAGAEVVGIDLSSVAVTRATARTRRRSGEPRARFVQMDAERLAFADGSFDLVCGSAILHHLDVDTALGEIARVLAPGGRAVFVEPLGHNPLINAYRRLTPSLRTEDEQPLRRNHLALARRHFGRVATEHFNLLALAGFPVGRRAPGIVRRLHRVDQALFARSALARRWAWMVVIELSEPVGAASS